MSRSIGGKGTGGPEGTGSEWHVVSVKFSSRAVAGQAEALLVCTDLG